MKKLLPDSLHLTTVLVASASTNAHNLAMKAGTLGEALYATAAGSLPPETMAGSREWAELYYCHVTPPEKT